MYGIIITNQKIGHNKYKIRRFKEEFDKLNVDLDVFVNDGTICEIVNGETKIHLPKTDFIIYLDKDIYLAKILEKNGYRLFNKSDFIKLCDDKTLTLIYSADNGFNVIDTTPSPLVYTDTLTNENFKFLDEVISRYGFPLVMKKVYGSLGEAVYLVNNKDELIELYSKYYRNPLLFEPYISSSKGRSVRALVINQKVVGVIQRVSEVDFRSNYGDNNHSSSVENPAKFIDFAQKIADLFKIEYAGIDLLYDKNNEPILCEINSNAFFEEFEKTTGINVAKLYAEMIIEKVGCNE